MTRTLEESLDALDQAVDLYLAASGDMEQLRRAAVVVGAACAVRGARAGEARA